MPRNRWLIAAGILAALAALLHVAIIFGGGDYYRFFGAGEAMAQAAERGSTRPAIITAGIAFILLVWALYAWAGAGLLRRPPLLRAGLVTISAILLLRALAPLPMLLLRPERVTPFVIWSSAIVLVYGLAFAVGTARAWPGLGRPQLGRSKVTR